VVVGSSKAWMRLAHESKAAPENYHTMWMDREEFRLLVTGQCINRARQYVNLIPESQPQESSILQGLEDVPGSEVRAAFRPVDEYGRGGRPTDEGMAVAHELGAAHEKERMRLLEERMRSLEESIAVAHEIVEGAVVQLRHRRVGRHSRQSSGRGVVSPFT
jgi:hypothetical protein